MRIKKRKCTTCGEECSDCPYADPSGGAGQSRTQAAGSGKTASPSKHAANGRKAPAKASPAANRGR
ncbi:MAG: hypothetical protein C0504_12385 [Candidatus Solibacter sp.]|nr:hypothetical protein [Candidatus Solibacter sp.]